MPNNQLDKVSEFTKILDMAESLQIDTMEELSSFKIFQPGMGLGVECLRTSQYVKSFASTRMHETSPTMLNTLKGPVPIPESSHASLFPGPIQEAMKDPLLGIGVNPPLKIFSSHKSPMDPTIFCEAYP